jgi:DsbC/DsbD-like thiol-disulfide interchange protein/cytochrome c biogenesis protein CcdA
MLAGLNLFFFFSLGILYSSQLYAQDSRVEELVDVEVISDTSAVSPGAEIWVGLQISLSPDWHIYWKNSGKSGYPTTLTWELPQGWYADTLQFPAPYLYEYEGLSGYALKNQFTLLCRLQAPVQLDEGTIVKGMLDALVCNESSCLPYQYSFSLNFEYAKEQKFRDENIEILSKAKDHASFITLDTNTVSTSLNGSGGRLRIINPEFSKLSTASFSFFPESSFIFPNPESLSFSPDTQSLGIDWEFAEGEEIPSSIEGILIHPELEKPLGLSIPLLLNESSSLKSNFIDGPVIAENDSFLLNLLLGFVLIAMAVWAYNRSQNPQCLTSNWKIFALLSLMVGIWLGYPSKTDESSSDGLNWEPWTSDLEEQLLAEGRAVYIDYTAKWCLSCQVNKRVYGNESVVSSLLDHDVALLRADWTKRSPEILKSLQSHGREGVPFNVYYPASELEKPSVPIYLPEILSSESLVNLINGDQDFSASSNRQIGYLALLGFAWLGGLILNLMPCVFPVIGLKIMGFVKQAGENRAQIKRHGWVFTLGVLISFWLLVGTLLLLRDHFEQQLGWGFQLQNPAFVLVLAILLFLFGLSLSGVFEIGMSITGLGAGLSRKSGLWGSFFSGILATVVATPCMAPFLGVAVGAALTMPFLSSLTVFTCIALGLSTPYLLLSFFPQWVQRLPKPGAWMDSFKELMAFPVYATVAWLLWTLDGLL